MKKLTKFRHGWKQTGLMLFLATSLAGLGGCDNNVELDTPVIIPTDPKQEIIFTGFTPNEGQVRTMMFIKGSNFGTDISKINVNIGGKTAKVISSNGNEIYCLVPARADGGYVEVEILDADGKSRTKHRFDQPFTYVFNTVVGTLCGTEDEEGNAAYKDGTFEEAGFTELGQMYIDHYEGNTYIYMFEVQTSRMRRIDLSKRMVETLVTNSTAGWNQVNSIAWSEKRDTMFVNNSQGNADGPAMYYLLRSEDFRVPHLAMYGDNINCVFINPADHKLYCMRGADAKVYSPTFNQATQMWDLGEPVMSVATSDQWFQSIEFIPTGKYAQAISRNKYYVWRSVYDMDNHKMLAPSNVAGSVGSLGYKDGAGTTAQFNDPRQGCFVYNAEYEGMSGVEPYDYYIADGANHCIRKVTPTGAVTTYAGRGSQSTDGNVNGYIDGDLREEARFDYPTGICYDENTSTFYISDANNHRIRTITVE